MNKYLIANYLKKIGLYKSVRWLYNLILRYKKHTEMSIAGYKIKFWTPTFYLDEYITNFVERNVIEKFIDELSTSDIVWDVGANIGIYSIFSANIVAPKGIVYAFEPEKKSFSLLKKNVESNKIENVITLPIALGDTNGKSILYPSDTPNFGAHSFVQRTDYRLKRKGYSVQVCKADSLVEDGTLEIPNVIKIDVEGAETLVIKGMRKTLENKKVRILICEVHTNLLTLFGGSQDYIESTLRGLGFSIETLDKRGNLHHLLFKR